MEKNRESVLVAGANGFVGHHLVDSLRREGFRVSGIGQDHNPSETIANKLESYQFCDLTDLASVNKLVLDGVIAVINLAGLANVGQSFSEREKYLWLNTIVHTNLYDKILADGLKPRILAVSSGSVYDPDQKLPISEEGKIIETDRTNPYTASKITMENTIEKYRTDGLDCVIVRPFNHIGPGQRSGFLVPDLADQILQAKRQGVPIKVGNLKTSRDYTDVRDVANAYVDLIKANQLNHNLYNVCSGKSVSGSFIIEQLLELFDASNLDIEVDESRIRPNDVLDIYGENSRLVRDTGWEPKISINTTLSDFTHQYQSEYGQQLAA